MSSNWFKVLMKMTKVQYGKNLLLKGMPIVFNKKGATIEIGENVVFKNNYCDTYTWRRN